MSDARPACPYCDCPIDVDDLDYDEDAMADYDCVECDAEIVVKRKMTVDYDVFPCEE